VKLTQEQIAHLRTLEDSLGKLTPDRVVEDAKRKQSPLHALFEWDKAKAAAIQWIAQAREIIGAVQIVVTNETTTVRTPVYVRDPDASGQGYRSVMALRADPDRARESLVYTLEVAAGHLRRAYELAQPLGLAMEVDALLDQIVGVQRSIKTAA
jgi:uncharacterized protein YigE (DUF2233 family)